MLLWGLIKKKIRYKYYKSSDFLNIKEKIEKEIIGVHTIYNNFKNVRFECLEIIERLKLESQVDSYIVNVIGVSDDVFLFNDNQLIYNCSLSICKNAENQPFKYICKYFKIKNFDVYTNNLSLLNKNLNLVNQIFNNIREEQKKILDNVVLDVPENIKNYRNELIVQLGLNVDLDYSDCILTYVFKYVSPKGQSNRIVEIPLNDVNIVHFLNYLQEKN